MAENFSLDHLRLIPNHRPAHRDTPTATTAQRIEMLEIATSDIPRLVVDSREALRDKASYTFDTLAEFKNEYPDASLVFFMGLDAFSKFDSWHRWQEILDLANLVVIDRPNSELSGWAADLVQLQQSRHGDRVVDAQAGAIERHSVTQLAISATDIRTRMANRQSIDFLVPERVKQYIVQHGLYS
ncbi:UNVERIFIED_CONTAM: hypothetical protein GTU68_035473 [Idotea baltica]|nr:hypothetical protein [Idotea baltica]